MEPRPSQPHSPEVESRDETIARIQREDLGAEAQAQPDGADPTSRRHLGRRLARFGLMGGLACAIVGVAVTLMVGGGWPLALGIGAAIVISAGVVIALIAAEDEDGRIERDVEHVVENRE